MIVSKNGSLIINGITALEKNKLSTIIECHLDLLGPVSIDTAQTISQWIKSNVKLNDNNDVDSLKYILANYLNDNTTTLVIPSYENKGSEKLATVNDDHFIEFSLDRIGPPSIIMAIALWIDSLDYNVKTTINGINPIWLSTLYPNKLLKLKKPVKYINLRSKEKSEVIFNDKFDYNSDDMTYQVKSIVNGVPVVETMTQYQLENQSKMVPYIAIHTSENKETNTVDNIYDVYIENDYVMAAIMNLMPTCSYIDVNSDIVEPLLIVNEKYKETATYKIGQIIQIHLTKDLNQPNTSNIETMSIKEAIKQLVELADERGLDSLIGISK